MTIETYFNITTSKGETVLHAYCLDQETDKIKNLVIALLSYPDSRKSLEFLMQKNLAGETAFHLIQPTKNEKGEPVWAPGTEAIWKVLMGAYNCLSTPPSQKQAQPTESVPPIFHFLFHKQYHLLGKECASGKGNHMYQNKTPLTFCVANRDCYGLKTLLKASGVDVNGRDGLGITPLIEAVMDENIPAIALLLEHGADPEAQDAVGLKPIDFARTLQNEAILELLQEPISSS